MPVYTVTCRDRPGAPAEELFVEALSAGQAMGYAVGRGRLVESVAITPRDRIEGDAVVLADDPDPPESAECAACGYSLEGLPIHESAVRCPECGRDHALVLLGRKAAIIRSTRGDVGAFDRQAAYSPGLVASRWAVVMAVLGFLHIGPALLAIALAVYALEQSNRDRGITGLALGTLAVIVRIAVSLV